jgi:hypothetical protein
VIAAHGRGLDMVTMDVEANDDTDQQEQVRAHE